MFMKQIFYLEYTFFFKWREYVLIFYYLNELNQFQSQFPSQVAVRVNNVSRLKHTMRGSYCCINQ